MTCQRRLAACPQIQLHSCSFQISLTGFRIEPCGRCLRHVLHALRSSLAALFCAASSRPSRSPARHSAPARGAAAGSRTCRSQSNACGRSIRSTRARLDPSSLARSPKPRGPTLPRRDRSREVSPAAGSRESCFWPRLLQGSDYSPSLCSRSGAALSLPPPAQLAGCAVDAHSLRSHSRTGRRKSPSRITHYMMEVTG